MVWIKTQLVGAYDGQNVTLECHAEAFPKSINYWSNEVGDMLPHNSKRCILLKFGYFKFPLVVFQSETNPTHLLSNMFSISII